MLIFRELQNCVGQGKVISPQMITPYTTLVMRKGEATVQLSSPEASSLSMSQVITQSATGSSPSESQRSQLTSQFFKSMHQPLQSLMMILSIFTTSSKTSLDGIPKRDIIMITDDFNAKIGEGVQHEDESRESVRMAWEVEMREVVYLSTSATITNTIFQQHPRRKYTWIFPNGLVRNQIVNILISSRWKFSIEIANSLPGADIGSDQQLLLSDLRIKLKMTKSSPKPLI